MNISAINLELAKIGYKAVKLPKPKKASNGLTIWAKRRIARAYKGAPATAARGESWSYRDLGFGFLVRLWHDATIEPRFESGAVARYLRVTVPPRKLARMLSA